MSGNKLRKRNLHARKERIFKNRVKFCCIMILVILLLLFACNKAASSNSHPLLSNDVKNLYSPYSILLDAASGNVLAKQNENDKIYPASLTKIMTALLAIENIDNLNEELFLPADLFQELYSSDASMAGFLPDEHVNIEDLLYGILLPSGAECCLAVADRISGSESAFVELMNEKARELGMKNTHFSNSTGLHSSSHYSTVRDISVLLNYALKNNAFKKIFTSHSYQTHPSNQHPDGFTFNSTMFKSMNTTKVANGEIIGGKTGYTKEAGLCLASLAKINGKEYILVTAKAKGAHDTEQFHIIDAVKVYEGLGF